MDQLLTVLIQTSPIPSHPSTALLEALFKSFQRVDGLLESQIIILCDGCEEICANNKEEKENNKHGKVTSDTASRYRQHIQNLKDALHQKIAASPFAPKENGSIKLFELQERHGSARGIKAAFMEYNLITTPFVMICQHDNFFIQNVPLRSCVHLMSDYEGLGVGLSCLHFMSTATMNYTAKIRKRYNLDIASAVVPIDHIIAASADVGTYPNEGGGGGDFEVNGTKLIPLVFWYGRTHLAYTNYYTNFILDRNIQTGDHLEELLGVLQLRDICERGLDVAHKDYGNFVLDQGCGEVIYHLSGRRVRAAATAPSISSVPSLPSVKDNSVVNDQNVNDGVDRSSQNKTVDETESKASTATTVAPTKTTSSNNGNTAQTQAFTTAKSCKAIVPGLEIIPDEQQSSSKNDTNKNPRQKRFKQRCFHCGIKGHSYKFCPGMMVAPETKQIDLS
mmetsp:Transcript_17712/g.26414  ORF Transcript_17712/g.26414 Transcript_17712/m.26414 type:complete len:449 (-) Transcript_17712:276-1622(-)